MLGLLARKVVVVPSLQGLCHYLRKKTWENMDQSLSCFIGLNSSVYFLPQNEIFSWNCLGLITSFSCFPLTAQPGIPLLLSLSLNVFHDTFGHQTIQVKYHLKLCIQKLRKTPKHKISNPNPLYSTYLELTELISTF